MRLTRFEWYASDAVTIHLSIFRGRGGMVRVVVDSATLHSNPWPTPTPFPHFPLLPHPPHSLMASWTTTTFPTWWTWSATLPSMCPTSRCQCQSSFECPGSGGTASTSPARPRPACPLSVRIEAGECFACNLLMLQFTKSSSKLGNKRLADGRGMLCLSLCLQPACAAVCEEIQQ